MAGGVADRNRYPWDSPQGPATGDKASILAKANTTESGIEGTSPAGMYPLGASRPFGLMGLAGNVWEWTDSWYDEGQTTRVVRGGSWDYDADFARCAVRRRGSPGSSDGDLGFRLVSPVVSGS